MALAITRRQQQGFLIGENIHVMVVQINKQQVKLAITAPKDVNIVRDELDQACVDRLLFTGKEKKEAKSFNPLPLDDTTHDDNA